MKDIHFIQKQQQISIQHLPRNHGKNNKNKRNDLMKFTWMMFQFISSWIELIVFCLGLDVGLSRLS